MSTKNYVLSSAVSLPERILVVWFVCCIVSVFAGITDTIFYVLSLLLMVNIGFVVAAILQIQFYRAFNFCPTPDLLFGHLFDGARGVRRTWLGKRVEECLVRGAKEIEQLCIKEKILRESEREEETFSLRLEIKKRLKEWRKKRNLARVFGFLVYESWKPYAN